MYIKFLMMVGGRVLMAQILEQQGMPNGLFYVSDAHGMSIVSSSTPQIDGSAFYVRGESQSDNENFIFYRYRSGRSAEESREKFIKTFAEYFQCGVVCTDGAIFEFRRER